MGFSKTLFKQHKPSFCPAARNYFTIAWDGAIYPCQNLPETQETLIGHLADADLNQRIRDSPILRQINEANRNASEVLGEKWFSSFCKVCPVYNLSETKMIEQYAPSRARLYERMGSSFVSQLLRIASNADLYERFLVNVQEQLDRTFEPNVF
jgi:radical SAM protein with 4Fe4S-binding SPASM domain